MKLVFSSGCERFFQPGSASDAHASLRVIVPAIDRAAARVTSEFRRAPTSARDAAYSRRLYSHELYHQLRVEHGRRVRPQPGPDTDLAIEFAGDVVSVCIPIEVQPSTVSVAGLRESLRRLRWCVEAKSAPGGLLILFGESYDAARTAARLERATPQGLSSHVRLRHWLAGDGIEILYSTWRGANGEQHFE